MKKYIDNILYWIDKLLKRPNLDWGLIETKPKEIEKKGDFVHKPYTFGNVDKKLLKNDGDYRDFLPVGEQQNRNKKEKMHCVSEAVVNSIETRINYLISLGENARDEEKEIVNVFKGLGFIQNNKCLISTRFVAKGSGTTRRGNNFRNVCDFIRHNGLVPKHMYPWVDDWDEYYQEFPNDIVDYGKKILDYIEILHEWVSPRNFKGTLPFGPIATSGYAWERPVNGIYQKTTKIRNHAIMLDFIDKLKEIFDSYNPFQKTLAEDFILGYGKLVTLRLIKPYKNKYEKMLENGQKFLINVDRHGEFYKITPTGLVYVSERSEIDSIVSKELGLDAKLVDLTKLKKLVWMNQKDFNLLK